MSTGSITASPTCPTSTAGRPHFQADLLERAIEEINELQPDGRGDQRRPHDRRLSRASTARPREYLDRIECERLIVIPGNHDSRNVGLRPLRGAVRPARARRCTRDGRDDRRRGLHRAGPRPRRDRPGRYEMDRAQFVADRRPPTCACSCCTTTCCRSRAPGASATSSTTRATRSRCCCARACNLVLAGHKHVPYAWRLEDLFVVTTGTVSTLRLRGQDAALLQRDRGGAGMGSDLPQVPLCRAGDDHRVFARDARVREARPRRGVLRRTAPASSE